MAISVHVDVETNNLGEVEIFYPSDGYAEVHFFPKPGVLIDYKYQWKYTVTYKPEWELEPKTYTGEGRYNGFTWMVQDENCPLGIECSAGGSSSFESVSWEITITGNASVFPYSIIPEGSGSLIWFYRRPLNSSSGNVLFYWKLKVKKEGFKFVRAIFYYSDNTNNRFSSLDGACEDKGYSRCIFWFRKFTFLPLYSSKTGKLIRSNDKTYSEIVRDGDYGAS